MEAVMWLQEGSVRFLLWKFMLVYEIQYYCEGHLQITQAEEDLDQNVGDSMK